MGIIIDPFFGAITRFKLKKDGDLVCPEGKGQRIESDAIRTALEVLELVQVYITIPPEDNVPYILLRFRSAETKTGSTRTIEPFWGHYVGVSIRIPGRRGLTGRLTIFPDDKSSVWVTPLTKSTKHRDVVVHSLQQLITYGKTKVEIALALRKNGVKRYSVPVHAYTPPHP